MGSAIITFKEPWAQSGAWKAGDKAKISWIADSQDFEKPCFIELLTGDATNAQVVASATDAKNPVKCSQQQFEVTSLNDFRSGEYWLRIGQKQENIWYYSGVFKFDGKGTFEGHPVRMQDGQMDYPLLGGAPGTSKKASGTESSASATASPTSQPSSNTGNANGAKEVMPKKSTSAGAEVQWNQWTLFAAVSLAAAFVM
ncbi:hypothetical protein DM01DRAFT_1338115 [Hesseltinella vesiculosa]|uniref:Uncharacterized protein n=1 Tax=Hesseltinella vesiculosa TaxID=101127 RepID=A0A1X2GAR4_9FUNG|nr:hypothetical protein DM01DRAFT_1338115 [Hesseltinella vesiculosa]